MRDRESGSGESYKCFYLLYRVSVEEDLIERFSNSRHLEELHKHQTGDKKAVFGFPLRGVLGKLYRVGSEAAHLRGRAATALTPCCMEAVVYSLCAAFDKHMRQFSEQSHLSYTPMPPMMDIVGAAVATVSSTSIDGESCGDLKCENVLVYGYFMGLMGFGSVLQII
ncbi:hypothetical protein M9H77_17185 [Catharanthus roseus]|uniref:Uncharacterized protein n=1 Tax=Catharanthus roseus TaxID=4058 RepID=A0ACC0B3W1_CATRO|nr:hypothetical protein M9H77_17185 [Catharanthus roseus]